MKHLAPMANIHRTALVDPEAMLGRNVSIGPFTIVHSNVEIGDDTMIGSHCELGVATPLSNGSPLSIGNNSLIRSHSVFYQGSSFGPELEAGHRITVREGTKAGVNFRVGTLSDLQGNSTFGDYVRLHSNVHVGKGTHVGSFVWIFPYVVLTNDPTPPSETRMGCTVADFAVIATMCVVLPGVHVGSGALIGAGSNVTKDVSPERIACGSPAIDKGPASRVMLRDGSGPAYPWREQFHRGYPEEVVQGWLNELKRFAT